MYWRLLVIINSKLKVSQEKKPCIKINIRELNKEFCTRLSILCTLD